MKCLILPILLLSLATISLLFGQEDIQLPQVVITGETEIFADSVRKDTDLSRYWTLEEPAAYAYVFYPASEPESPEMPNLSSSGLIQGFLGTRDYGSLRALYRGEPVKEGLNPLNFSGDFRTINYDKGWETSSGNLHWMPSWDLYSADVYYDWTRYDSDLQEYVTENNGFGAILPGKKGVAVGPLLAVDEQLEISFYTYRQSSEISGLKDRDANDFNILYKGDIEVPRLSSGSHIELGFLNNTITGNLSFFKKDFLTFKELGLWAGGDGRHIYPSIVFNWQKMIFYNTSLKILNQPYTGNLTRMQLIRRNPYQNIDIEKHQPKAPLNMTVAFEVDMLIPFTVWNRTTWIKDYTAYAHTDSMLYEGFLTDVLWNRSGVDFSYTYQRFDFVDELTFNILQDEDGDRIPFMPMFENLFAITYNQEDWNLTLQAQYIHDRENEDETSMENVMLTNILGNWHFQPQFELSGGIYNLLNEEYREYRELPARETHFQAGICWYFR